MKNDLHPTTGSQSSWRYTLALALGSTFTLVSVFGTALVGVVMYFAVSHILRSELAHRMSHTTGISAMLVDAEKHSLLQHPDDEQSDYYRELKAGLLEAQSQSDDVAYVYTVRMVDEGEIVWLRDSENQMSSRLAGAGGEIVFVVDSDPEDSYGRLREVYDEAPDLLKEIMRGGAQPNRHGVYVSEDFYTDRWGTFLTGYVPIRVKDGQIRAVLCTDITATAVLANERKYKLIVAGLCALIALITIPIGLTFASWIRNPLRELGDEMNRIGSFDLDDRDPARSRIIEVNEMNQEVKGMKSSLRSFSRYVPARLVRQLLEAGMEAELGGTKREVSIFFSDIAGFTTVSEQLSPEQLVEFLGQYLDVVAETLMSHGATVDKYIGDAVMAFWNAPVSQPDHAYRACTAALDCMARIEELNAHWEKEGHRVVFNTRIGVHTGEAIVGNIGSQQRLSYTIIGDDVNLASRLEGANKAYGTMTMISGSTYEQVRGKIVARRIDRVAVKGKSIPVDFYELLAREEEAEQTVLDRAECRETGFELYVSRRFSEARAVFRKLLDLEPEDAAAEILWQRCCRFEKDPPREDWDGSFVLTEK